MIKFIECLKSGYAARTEENIKQSDITIAFADNFNTTGEKLTYNTCRLYSKKICRASVIDLTKPSLILDFDPCNKDYKINIAGNGIYTLTKLGYSQQQLNEAMYIFLNVLSSTVKINLLRSGGQTGIDEAGLEASSKLGIETICLAPKGWMFRNKNGIDIHSERLFKERFKNI